MRIKEPKGSLFFSNKLKVEKSIISCVAFFVSSDIYWRSKTEMPNGLWLCEMKWETMFYNSKHFLWWQCIMFTKTCYSCLSPGIHGSKQENNMLFKKYIEIGGVTCSEPGLLSQDPGKFPTMLSPTWITICSKKNSMVSFISFFSITVLRKSYILVITNLWRFTSGLTYFWAWEYLYNAKKFQKYSHACIHAFIYSTNIYGVLLKCQALGTLWWEKRENPCPCEAQSLMGDSGGGGGMNWEFSVSRCKLLHIEWMDNKVLLYSTGNYIQCPGINHNGKEYKKECVYEKILLLPSFHFYTYTYVCIIESLCCTAEINTTL